MFKILMIAVIALLMSTNVLAQGLYVDTQLQKLTYKQVGKVICFKTMINVKEHVVDAVIFAQLQEIRGKDLYVIVNEIRTESGQTAPAVIVMAGVSFSKGESVWTENQGWYTC